MSASIYYRPLVYWYGLIGWRRSAYLVFLSSLSYQNDAEAKALDIYRSIAYSFRLMWSASDLFDWDLPYLLAWYGKVFNTKFNRVYTIYILNVDSFTSIKCLIIATAKIANFTIKSKLFIEFIEYVNVFDIEKADVLVTYNKNKYTINLDGNKPFFGPLYNLSAKKLKVLKMYFNDALAKG
jgi:hypothetical protein